MKPWYQIPIVDNNEKLISIPSEIDLIDPHPYLALGAPYKSRRRIWSLREGVVSRLVRANNYLQTIHKNYSLILYDTWRPIEVQSYMFNLAYESECKRRGVEFQSNDMNSHPEIIKKVEKFWAYPSPNIKNPPPHSTGAAIDITFVDENGVFLDMGCDIDQMDDTAIPDYYQNRTNQKEKNCHYRRKILRETMYKFGFVQHPNEWWHFSYGDQLWAWKNNEKNAIYGKV